MNPLVLRAVRDIPPAELCPDALLLNLSFFYLLVTLMIVLYFNIVCVPVFKVKTDAILLVNYNGVKIKNANHRVNVELGKRLKVWWLAPLGATKRIYFLGLSQITS